MADRRVLAFAGNGETSLENARAVLDNWIGEADIAGFFLPESISKRKQPGLANIVSYLTDDWGSDEDDAEDPFDTFPASEMLFELTKAAGTGTKDAPEPFLVVILGDAEPDEATATLIDEAREKSISVLDLGAGMDEYTADGGTEPAAAEPEAPQEKRTRRRASADTSGEDAPAETGSGTSRTKRQIGKPRTAPDAGSTAEDKPPFDGPTRPASEVFPPAHSVSTDLPTEILEAQGTLQVTSQPDFKAVLIVALRGALAALEGKAVEAHPDEPTAAYIEGADGAIRKRGRGKPRSGEKAVWLTAAEAAAQGYTEES